jgi:hypothetical protein
MHVVVLPPWSAVPPWTGCEAQAGPLDEDVAAFTGFPVGSEHVTGEPDPTVVRPALVHCRHPEPEASAGRELHTRPPVDDQLVTGQGIGR